MRRFLSVVLYLGIGLPIVFSSLLLLSARPWILDREFYRHAVTDERLYALLRSPEVSRTVDEKITIGATTYSGPALVSAIQKHLPEAEIKELSTGAIDSVFALLKSGVRGEVRIDLRPLKAALGREAGPIVVDYLAALPPSKMPLGTRDLSGRSGELPAVALEKAARSAFSGLVDAIPDVTTAPEPRSVARIGVASPLDQNAVDRFTLMGAGLSSILLLGLGFLGGRGRVASLARAGRMLLIPSIAVLATGVILSLPGAPLFLQLIPPEARQLAGSGAMKEAGAWFASVFGQVSKSFFIVGLIGVSAGGLLASLRRIFEPKEI